MLTNIKNFRGKWKRVMTKTMEKKRKLETDNRERKVVGIVGGVGPEASNKFCEFLIKYKKAKTDQENLTFLHYCNPKIPDRTEFIMEKGPDPTNELIKSCNVLKEAGADFLVIPCNTAHYFLPEVQRNTDIPILDMTKLLVKKIVDKYPKIKKVGILATTGSINTRIYQEYFNKVDVEVILPSLEDQENLVMKAIYGNTGIKAGKKFIPKKKLLIVANKLIEEGAEAIVLGCTEIPLVLKQKDFNVKLFDPMIISAKEIIKYIEKEEKTEVVTVEHHLKRPIIINKNDTDVIVE